jgi:hypothetical protein
MARPSQLDAQVCVCGTERSSLSAVNVMAQDWGGALMFISLPADATAALHALAEFLRKPPVTDLGWILAHPAEEPRRREAAGTRARTLSRLPTSGLPNAASVQPGPSGRSNDRDSTTPQNSLRWL